MQNGFSVKFSDFEADRLATPGAREAGTPEGMEAATEIPIEYMYPLNGADKDVQARLVVECPMMRSTSKGIQPPKPIKGKPNTDGKPAIQVVFDKTNPEHVTFIGDFGNQYEYTEDDDRIVQVHKDNPVKATGVLGSIRDWCIYQYALFLASKKGKSTPSGKQFMDAEAIVLKKIFWMKRIHDDGPLKGQVDETSNAVRFFKLMNYRPGTPEANSAKFCLQDGTKVNSAFLYGRCFDWTPFLSFRRIFDGATFSVQMEVTESVINDFIETSVGMPIRTSRLVERLSKENPDQAAIVAEKYRLLQAGAAAPAAETEATPKPAGIKVDEIHTPGPALKETPTTKDPEPEPETAKVTPPTEKTESRSRRRSASPSPDEQRAASPDPDESRTETSSRRRPTLPRRKE